MTNSNFVTIKIYSVCFELKSTILIFVFLSFFSVFSSAQDTSLKVQYGFNNKSTTDSIVDETGNGYTAKLMGGARIKKLGKFRLLEIGAVTGYVDMGTKLGEVISVLTNFTISTYLYIDPATVLTNAGNFVWTFSNSANISTSATGCLFYTAKDSRYAISKTNYSAEKTIKIGTAATKGAWKHVAYTQSGNTGTIYIDGVSTKTGNITLLPTTLGATAFNYIGKSPYGSDQILLNSMLYDFRIYNKALTATQVSTLTTNLAVLDTLTYTEKVDSAVANLTLGNTKAIAADITLPLTGYNGATILWSSSNTSIITNSGLVTRPSNGSDTVKVLLTATVSMNFVSKKVSFNVGVVPSLSDLLCVQTDATNITISGNLTNLRSNIQLPQSGKEGSVISWGSNKPTVLSNSGIILSRPAIGTGNAKVTMTATVTKGASVSTHVIDIFVAENEGFSAYLFAYFTGNTGNQEAIRFAISNDGYTYSAVNGNNPIITSASISSSGGVRDPHILRGENNDYFMVATDMVSALGWSSNRAMVLLKSTNLTDWQSSIVNIPNTYSEYSAADRVWAPQTIYDPSVGKYMIYFAMRLGSSDYDKIYYAYANSSFIGLESSPKVLFDNGGLSTIDADIVLKDGIYNLFFKTEGNGNGIKKAVSTKLNGGYVLYDKYLQSTTNAVEGGCVFRMYNSDNWILMYDMYTSGAYQFTSSTDLTIFSVVSNAVSFDFTPRHGTIIPITSSELQALKSKWLTSIVVNERSDFLHISTSTSNNTLNVIFNQQIPSNLILSVFDLNGAKILNQPVLSKNEKLNISNLKSGIYFLTCCCNNQPLSSKKFIIR